MLTRCVVILLAVASSVPCAAVDSMPGDGCGGGVWSAVVTTLRGPTGLWSGIGTGATGLVALAAGSHYRGQGLARYVDYRTSEVSSQEELDALQAETESLFRKAGFWTYTGLCSMAAGAGLLLWWAWERSTTAPAKGVVTKTLVLYPSLAHVDSHFLVGMTVRF